VKLLKAQKSSKRFGLRQKHPGVILGHRFCQGEKQFGIHATKKNVPKNIGWLWNAPVSGLPVMRRGWRPGAVKKSVAKIMKVHLATLSSEQATVPLQEDPPTLRVLKKNGEFVIVMNPLHVTTETRKQKSPIVFKITETDEAKKPLTARNILHVCGVEKKCNCSTVDSCLNGCEKARLTLLMQSISKELCLKPSLTIRDLEAPNESEVDIKFTPPSADILKNSCVKYKPAKISLGGTQYKFDELDFDHEDGHGNDNNPEEVETKKSKKQMLKKNSKQDVKKARVGTKLAQITTSE
jgi:hypothetical protein